MAAGKRQVKWAGTGKFSAGISCASFLLSAWTAGASAGNDFVCSSYLFVDWNCNCGGISCHVSGYGSTVYFADSLHPALLFSGKFGSENVWPVWKTITIQSQHLYGEGGSESLHY